MRGIVQTVAKATAIVGLVAANLFMATRPAFAQTYTGYCTKVQILWECSDSCPPLGCNCSCNVNCAAVAC